MPNKKEKPYPKEFKESAVKLAIESTNPVVADCKRARNQCKYYTWKLMLE